MKKQQLVPVLAVTAVAGFVALLVFAADSAKPGDPLYTLDRTAEAAKLSLYKSVNRLAYGRLNLRLADERFIEIKALQTPTTTSMLAFPKVQAQTSLEQQLREQIAILLADISKNLTEAQDALFALPAAQQEEFSLEVAEKTTEYGNELTEIIMDLNNTNTEGLKEAITKLEKLDQSAVELLVNSHEDEAESETEDENDDSISEVLQGKLETKLLKLREELRIYVARMETNRTQLSAEDIARATALVPTIANQLATAEVQLGQQQYKTVSDVLDLADDDIDELKDLVKVEGDEDAGSESNDETEQENENEDESENEDQDKDEDEDEDKPTPTSTRSVKSTPKPTEKPEDNENEQEDEQEEEEEEVEGAQTQPSSSFDLLRNQLRF